MQSGNLNLQEKDLCGCVLDLPMATTVAICRRLALCRSSSPSLLLSVRSPLSSSFLQLPLPLSLLSFLSGGCSIPHGVGWLATEATSGVGRSAVFYLPFFPQSLHPLVSFIHSSIPIPICCLCFFPPLLDPLFSSSSRPNPSLIPADWILCFPRQLVCPHSFLSHPFPPPPFLLLSVFIA